MIDRRLVLLCSLLPLAGCGLKGDLYLPPEQPPADATPADEPPDDENNDADEQR
ncbi:MAG: lipoprotein [Gammaproteobacteria bacterium]|nr:lipoprotein [Gammaproteobacteria bacterium]